MHARAKQDESGSGFGADLRHGRAKGDESSGRDENAAAGLVLYEQDNDNN